MKKLLILFVFLSSYFFDVVACKKIIRFEGNLSKIAFNKNGILMMGFLDGNVALVQKTGTEICYEKNSDWGKNELKQNEIKMPKSLVSLEEHPSDKNTFACATSQKVYINFKEIMSLINDAGDPLDKKIIKISWRFNDELVVGVNVDEKTSRIYVLKNLEGKWVIRDVFKKNKKVLDIIVGPKKLIVASYCGGEVIFYNPETWKEETFIKVGVSTPERLAFDETNNIFAVVCRDSRGKQREIYFFDLNKKQQKFDKE